MLSISGVLLLWHDNSSSQLFCQQGNERAQETQVILPLSNRGPQLELSSGNSELLDLQKQKLELEIEYLKRQLARFERDELRELEIYRHKLEIAQIEDRIAREAEARARQRDTRPIEGQLREELARQPASERLVPETSDNNRILRPATISGDSIESLANELLSEQQLIQKTRDTLGEYAQSLSEEIRQMSIRRKAMETELEYLRNEIRNNPNTRLQNEIDQLVTRYEEFEASFVEANDELKGVSEAMVRLVSDHEIISQVVLSLAELKTNIDSIREFRESVDERLR